MAYEIKKAAKRLILLQIIVAPIFILAVLRLLEVI
jgi:hypothetical protein